MNRILTGRPLGPADPLMLFTAREEYLHRAVDGLRSDRVVVISGPPGTGKTSLAMAVARQITERAGGEVRHWNWNRLMSADEFLSGDGIRELRAARVNIVDDLEYAAVDPSVLVAQVRKQARSSSIMLVSRQPLPLRGAVQVNLGPFTSEEALAFVNRAQTFTGTRFAEGDVREIIALTGGVPALLMEAVSLAAEQGLSIHQIVERLRSFRAPGLIDARGQPLNAEDLSAKTIIDEVSSVNARLLEMARRDPRNLYAMSPRQFEELVAELLSGFGYEVTLTPTSKDGGFDMYAAARSELGRFLFLVECKRFREDRPVGVEIVRSLHGVVQQRQATAGIVATTSYFTSGAEAFERQVAYQLSLKDYSSICQWLSKSSGRATDF